MFSKRISATSWPRFVGALTLAAIFVARSGFPAERPDSGEASSADSSAAGIELPATGCYLFSIPSASRLEDGNAESPDRIGNEVDPWDDDLPGKPPHLTLGILDGQGVSYLLVIGQSSLHAGAYSLTLQPREP